MKGGREEKESERMDRWKFGWMDGWREAGGREGWGYTRMEGKELDGY